MPRGEREYSWVCLGGRGGSSTGREKERHDALHAPSALHALPLGHIGVCDQAHRLAVRKAPVGSGWDAKDRSASTPSAARDRSSGAMLLYGSGFTV